MGLTKKTLEYYKEKLQKKQRELLQYYLKNRDYTKETPDDGIRDLADQAALEYEREFLFALSDADRRLLRLIKEALERIAKGTYGYCQECGERISKKRLDAVPWARHCIKCQELQDKGLIK
ncbi:MAG: TraR/DksA family transcriptional regulator [Acidobacteria bacterium]|nr:TraR/DksA family transcriptional regulator [Acidobacteriota bacterium]